MALSEVDLSNPHVLLLILAIFLCIAVGVSRTAFNSLDRVYSKTLATVPGPAASHSYLGSLYEWITSAGLDKTREWIQQYGDVVRFKAVFGANRLIIADPAALAHLMNTAAYKYPKPAVARVRIGRVLSTGVVWAEGDMHRRQRRIMNPSFLKTRVYTLLPHFVQGSTDLENFWLKGMGEKDSAVYDVMDGLSRITMDTLGRAAFGLDFNCLERPDDPLMKVYRGFIAQAVAAPVPSAILINELSPRLPQWFSNLLYQLPFARYRDLLRRNSVAQTFATRVVEERKKKLANEGAGATDSEDILSNFLRANQSENPKMQLSNEELVAQIRTLIFAGHDSTTHTISYALYLLARNKKYQDLVRKEVTELLQNNPTAEDYEAAPWLNACIKESMRLLPAVPTAARESAEADILPLSTPIVATNGSVLQEIPIPAGTEILLSMADYNTSPHLWGADSYEFKPERFLRPEGPMINGKAMSGSFGGMLSFLTGPRICIGWRFAILEVQVVLARVLATFYVEEREKDMVIRKNNAPIMSPIVDGQIQNLPLRLTRVTA